MVSPDSLNEQYRALLEVSESITAHHDLTELFRALAQRLPRVVHVNFIILTLHDPERGIIRVHTIQANVPADLVGGHEGPVEESPAGLVWQTQESILIPDLAKEHRWPKVVGYMREDGMNSSCFVPLTTAVRRLGAIGFLSLQKEAYGETDLEFLQQVAKQVAVAVDNVLNFAGAEAAQQSLARERDRLSLVLKINNAVVSHLDLRELVRVISSCLGEALGINAVGLSLYEPETACFRVYYYDLPDTIPPMDAGATIPAEGSIGGLALTLGKPILINRASEAVAFPESKRRFYDHGFNSGGCVPLIMQGRKLGVLGLLSFREDAFPEERQQLLCQIADQIAIATENALNFERARKAEQALTRQLERERMLMEINNAVVSHLELPKLLKAVSASLRHVIPHDFAGFGIYDLASNQLLGHSLDFPSNQEFGGIGDPIPLEGTPEGLAFTSQKTVLIKNLNLVEFPAEIVQRGAAAGLKSGCAVPLIAHGRALGTLSVVSLRENAFSDDDAGLLSNIGSQLAIAVENVLAYQEIANLKDKLNKEKLYLEDEIRNELNFEEIIGESPTIKKVLKQVGIVAPTDSTVLIFGETGTGKELLARAIHDRSKRRERTFVKLNCAAIPTGLIESELFGHERGAFTGAIATKVGRFELADGGTLFLDEVGEIPLELQSKLLRVLQEQEFERLGSTRTIKVNVRLLAATNRDLLKMVEEKQFRSDLYYRLNVFPITSPSLQDRTGDIPLLVRYFTQRLARRMEKRIERIPSDAMEVLCRYPWPGNVRELENFIERAVILSQGTELSVPLGELKTTVHDGHQPVTTLQTAERDHILRALEKTNWVIAGPTGAATLLGMKRSTLQSRMAKLGIARRS
ncbi:MAG: sigma-54-dependent Fis family transcriptional regulator [Nitrospiraceae bacterium]